MERITEPYLFNIVLVHVSRTWERIRQEQEHQEMPCDNIQSVDEIVMIAEDIMDDEVIYGFLIASDEVRSDDYWIKNTPSSEGMSDVYIERLAHDIIIKEYL